jgi:hypothetical protein
LGTPYDWEAIVVDGIDVLPGLGQALHRLPWDRNILDQTVPGHVVCSSLAAWAYQRVGLAEPSIADWRYVTPADWADFIARKAWLRWPTRALRNGAADG